MFPLTKVTKERERERERVLILANIYLFKVNNRNTRKTCVLCSKLTIETPEWRHLDVAYFGKNKI